MPKGQWTRKPKAKRSASLPNPMSILYSRLYWLTDVFDELGNQSYDSAGSDSRGESSIRVFVTKTLMEWRIKGKRLEGAFKTPTEGSVPRASAS